MTKIVTGSIVRRKTGWSPMWVVHANPRLAYLRVRYCGSHTSEADDVSLTRNALVLVTDPHREFEKCAGWIARLTDEQLDTLHTQMGHVPCNPEGTDQMTKLYQTKEETARFGTLLARNSDGMAVLELRPSKEIIVVGFDKIEEVRPYTVSVKFAASANVYSYFAKPGSVEKGDLVVIDGAVATVCGVNTKSDKATKPLTGRKLLSAPIEVADLQGDVIAEDDDL